VERAYGRFERSFELPEDATTENIKAEFQDGLLRVHVTKNEKAQPHLIEVKID
jgi:HSP20 family protein